MKKKILLALLLSLVFNVGTDAHVIAPIKPIPDSLFRPVEIMDVDRTGLPQKPKLVAIKRPEVKLPTSPVIVVPKIIPEKEISNHGFKYDRNVSWYGPGFYGKRTACGQTYTKEILGVAHKTLPCGTLVTFKWGNRVKTVPVIDRGPYVSGRQWDLSGGLCTYLRHCFTGGIYFHLGA